MGSAGAPRAGGEGRPIGDGGGNSLEWAAMPFSFSRRRSRGGSFTRASDDPTQREGEGTSAPPESEMARALLGILWGRHGFSIWCCMPGAFVVFTVLAVPIVAGLVLALLWRPRRRSDIHFGKGARLNRFMVSERRPNVDERRTESRRGTGRKKAS